MADDGRGRFVLLDEDLLISRVAAYRVHSTDVVVVPVVIVVHVWAALVEQILTGLPRCVRLSAAHAGGL